MTKSNLNIQNAILGTRIAFFIAGFSLASWAPLIPLAKLRLAVTNGEFGFILLFFGVGSFITMPFVGILAKRFGCKKVFSISCLLVLCIMPFLVLLSSPILLACALFIFGAGIGAMDVVVNIHAVISQKLANKAIMSGFHALFSLGALAGAAMVSLCLILNVKPLIISFSILLFIAVLLIYCQKLLLNYMDDSSNNFFVVPQGIVILIGLMCFIAYIMEGSMLDWSAILIISKTGLNLSHAGLGYTIFAITMTIGRFFGDKLINQYGHMKVFTYTTIFTIIGFSLIVFSSSIIIICLAFLLIGAGLSNMAPILFTASGKQNNMPDSLAVSSVSTIGYLGILLGPAIIGSISTVITLNSAFLCITIASIFLFFGLYKINHLFMQ